MARIRTDRLWDLSQPVAHDGPAWVKYNSPVITRNYRRAAEGFNAETLTLTRTPGPTSTCRFICFLTAFPVLLHGCGGAWARAVAWELDADGLG